MLYHVQLSDSKSSDDVSRASAGLIFLLITQTSPQRLSVSAIPIPSRTKKQAGVSFGLVVPA